MIVPLFVSCGLMRLCLIPPLKRIVRKCQAFTHRKIDAYGFRAGFKIVPNDGDSLIARIKLMLYYLTWSNFNEFYFACFCSYGAGSREDA